jgi:hypothetical protein
LPVGSVLITQILILRNSVVYKIESGSNGFVLTSKQWAEKTGAIGIISKAGRYGGGTFAHKDIAFEFKPNSCFVSGESMP